MPALLGKEARDTDLERQEEVPKKGLPLSHAHSCFGLGGERQMSAQYRHTQITAIDSSTSLPPTEVPREIHAKPVPKEPPLGFIHPPTTIMGNIQVLLQQK